MKKRIQGHTDVPLNEVGRAQALAMAFNAAHHRFHAVYSSDGVPLVYRFAPDLTVTGHAWPAMPAPRKAGMWRVVHGPMLW